MRPFDYHSATTLGEVTGLLRQGAPGAARPLAGGTDLLTLMKGEIATPSQLIDIKRLPDLPRGVKEEADGVQIGALTTLAEIETSALLGERYPVLTEAAAVAATSQLRNMATIGGNLLQRPRCWYFRDPLFHCWLKGGDECQARDGENSHHALFAAGPCVAVHPSDLAPALLALDAEARVVGGGGERTVPLATFFQEPTAERQVENELGDDELIVAIRLPASAAARRGTYQKAMERKTWSFALVSVAATIRAEGERIADARLVLGGVSPIPHRAEAAEGLLVGAEASPATFERVAGRALEGASPLRHNDYKIALTRALIVRALTALTDSSEAVAAD